MSSCAVDVSKFSDTSDRWSIEYMLVVDLQGRAACNSLKEIAIVVVHHDRTPQSNVSGHSFWDLGKHKCCDRFLDPGISVGVQGDKIFVCGAKGCEREGGREGES